MSGSPRASVGEYQLLDEVARGGQGAVFRALRPDGAQVALKVLLDLEPESLARFEREALGLARLQHPNVVRVHDYGREGHKPYLVMEWIEGETLFERVRRGGPLEPPEAVKVLSEIASALSHCHSLGIVHRDLKPQNVVLPAERGAVLVDFGLVREVGGGGGELAQRLTATGEVLGTPSYMAPEQADSRFGEVSSATDVYALGATLYFMLTGSPPLELSGGLVTALIELLEGAPPDPRACRPDLPTPLAVLCLRCLAKRPHQRPADAAAFLADLHASSAGGPSTTGRRPWVIGLAALLALTVVAGLSTLDLEPPPPMPLRPQSPAPSLDPTSTTPAAPAPSDPSPTPAGTPPDLFADTLSLIKTHLFVNNNEKAWSLIEGALADHPNHQELLSLGVHALERRGKTSQPQTPDQVLEAQARAAQILDLHSRLHALAPSPERAIKIGAALRIYSSTRPPLGDEERVLASAVVAMDAASNPSDEALGLKLSFEQGWAHVRKAELHYGAKRWRESEESAALGQARLAPNAPPGSSARQRLARAVELKFVAAFFRLKRLSGDLTLRFEEAVAALESLCGPHDQVSYECLGRVYAHASNLRGSALRERVARAESAAEAYQAAYDASPERKPTRGNLLVYALIHRSRHAWLQREYARALGLLLGAFSLPKVTTQCKSGPLRRAYRDVWAARLRWRGERDEGRKALRQALQDRPWASERQQDQAWIEELERELRALLTPR